MTGADDIRAMRRDGLKPKTIWVSDFADALVDPENVCKTVSVAGDTPELLDLRFLLGVDCVIVEGADQSRIDRITAAVMLAGAKRVVASTFQSPTIGRVADTEGVMSWK